MTQNDPTDHALAAIASILDRNEMHEPKETEQESERVALTVISETIFNETVVTETVVAEKVVAEDVVINEPETIVDELESPATVPEAIDVDGYSRVGPGPLDAIRFRWTVRRDEDGHYFVDETIGTQSRPMTSGPMPREDVIHFIDERADATQKRFDALKTEMTIAP